MTRLAEPVTATSTVRTSLVARSETLRPDGISRRLGIKPSVAWRRDEDGQTRPGPRRRQDHWALEVGNSEGDGLAEHLAALVAQLPHEPHPDVRLFAFVSLSGRGDISRFTASAGVLGRLAQRDVHVVFDLYPPVQRDASSEARATIGVDLVFRLPGGHSASSAVWDAATSHRLAARGAAETSPSMWVRVPSGAPSENPLDDHITWLSDRVRVLPDSSPAVSVSYASPFGQGATELSPSAQKRMAESGYDLWIDLLRKHSFSGG